MPSEVTQETDLLGIVCEGISRKAELWKRVHLSGGWHLSVGSPNMKLSKDSRFFRPPNMDCIAEILNRVSSLQHQLYRPNGCMVVSISILQLVIIGPLCPITWAIPVNMLYNRHNLLDLFPRPLYLSQVTNSETWKFCVVRPKRNCVQRQKTMRKRSRH